MSKFDAGAVVEPMTYDFTAFGGKSGTIPEPSSGQVDTFMADVRAMIEPIKDLFGKDTTDLAEDADLAEKVSALPDDLVAGMSDQMTEAVAKFCSGSPSKEEIEALPYRVQTAFMAWLMSELRPEGKTAASTR